MDAITENRIVIKDVSESADIDVIVKIHMSAFKGFFLTALGEGFLKQMYKGFSEHNKSGIFGAYDENSRLLGFLAYSSDLSGFYKYLLKTRLIQFAFYSLIAFLKTPKFFMRLIKAFLKPSESVREENYLELSSIGVLPEAEGRGIGGMLIERLKEIFDSKEFAYIKLETDADGNDGVNKFYQKNGFVCVGDYVTSEGRRMNEYRWYEKAQDAVHS